VRQREKGGDRETICTYCMYILQASAHGWIYLRRERERESERERERE